MDNSILSFIDYLPENEKIKVALERLEEMFNTQPWIKHIKLIKTAAVPLIKLTMDTSVTFLDPSYGEVFLILNRPHNSGLL